MTENSASRQTSHKYRWRPDSRHVDHLLSEVDPKCHVDPQRVTGRYLSADQKCGKSGVIDDRQKALRALGQNST